MVKLPFIEGHQQRSFLASDPTIDLNVCSGGASYCDSTWTAYPNLNSALYGIDVPSLNPMPNDFISEPGVRNQIFQATYRETTGNMVQYDFIQAVDDLRCDTSFNEYIFSTFEELISGWNSMETSRRDIQIGRSMDISVSAHVGFKMFGIGASTKFTLPPMFTRSSSSSHESEGMEKHFNISGGSVAHSRAECSIFRIMIDIQNPTLQFYSGFEATLLYLDDIARNGTLSEKRQAGINFFEQYGSRYACEKKLCSSLKLWDD